jgi:enoyl-CoA hydratase/carnithine racemase
MLARDVVSRCGGRAVAAAVRPSPVSSLASLSRFASSSAVSVGECVAHSAVLCPPSRPLFDAKDPPAEATARLRLDETVEPFAIEELDTGVRVVTMGGGEGESPVNAMDTVFMARLMATYFELEEATDNVRPVVFASGAPKAWCAGLDVPLVHSLSHEELRAFTALLDGVCMKSLLLHSPSVAALSGAAIAGGAILAMGATMRVGVNREKALFGVNETRFGVGFPRGPNAVIRTRLMTPAARQLVFGGHLVSPQRAHDVGLIDHLVEDGADVVSEAARLADETFPADTNDAYFYAAKELVVRPTIMVDSFGGDEATDEWIAMWEAEKTRNLRVRYFESRGIKLD